MLRKLRKRLFVFEREIIIVSSLKFAFVIVLRHGKRLSRIPISVFLFCILSRSNFHCFDSAGAGFLTRTSQSHQISITTSCAQHNDIHRNCNVSLAVIIMYDFNITSTNKRFLLMELFMRKCSSLITDVCIIFFFGSSRNQPSFIRNPGSISTERKSLRSLNQ